MNRLICNALFMMVYILSWHFLRLQLCFLLLLCVNRFARREWHLQKCSSRCSHQHQQSPCTEEEPDIRWLRCRLVTPAHTSCDRLFQVFTQNNFIKAKLPLIIDVTFLFIFKKKRYWDHQPRYSDSRRQSDLQQSIWGIVSRIWCQRYNER